MKKVWAAAAAAGRTAQTADWQLNFLSQLPPRSAPPLYHQLFSIVITFKVHSSRLGAVVEEGVELGGGGVRAGGQVVRVLGLQLCSCTVEHITADVRM